MKIADIPDKFPIPFADAAGVGFINPIPELPTGVPGKASLTDGFPPPNFDPVASGGIPPSGSDMNGLQNQITKWIQWSTAGGIPVKWDSTFATDIGGYPQGAFIQSATLGKFWISSVDDNPTNPDTGGANWISFPDVLIQLQAGNYAEDTGAVNQIVITLSPVPVTRASLIGAPIRVKVGNSNTVTNPTININGLGAIAMVTPDGSALAVAQLVVGGIMEGFVRDDDKFQVNAPVKPTATATQFITGCIYIWPTETVPVGTLECNGATLLISSYPNLFALLGTRYGGNGTTNFKLPNYRGEFMRGWDHGRGLDPSSASRTNAGGGITGDHVGTNQLDLVGSWSGSGSGTADAGTGTAAAGSAPVTIGVQDSRFPSKTLATFDSAAAASPPQIGNGGSGQIQVAVAPLQGTAAVPARSVTIPSRPVSVTVSGGGVENRPVNIYVMYVIGI